MLKRLSVIGTVIAATFCLHAKAATELELYELQERCGQRASTVFQSEYGGGGASKTANGVEFFSYENHYSATLHKCYFLEILTSSEKGISGQTKHFRLFDLNDRRELGTFVINYSLVSSEIMEIVVICELAGKSCATSAQWNALLKPYMMD